MLDPNAMKYVRSLTDEQLLKKFERYIAADPVAPGVMKLYDALVSEHEYRFDPCQFEEEVA